MLSREAARAVDLQALNRHQVCRPCLQGENGEEKPNLIFLNDELACPNHGALNSDDRITGALLLCFLQALDLD